MRRWDELAQLEGVAAVLIGPNDLAYDITGVRGSMTPEVIAAIDHVSLRLRKAGKPFGMPCAIADIPLFMARGASLVYYPVEWLLERALAELAGYFRDEGQSSVSRD